MDKNQSMVEFIQQCPTIQNNPLFFNFAESGDGHNHFITGKDYLKKSYIDGSVLKQYTFSIASYYSVSHNAIIQADEDENIENMAKVQEILDWIDEQSNLHNFPDFGTECEVEDIESITTDPDIDGIDTSVNPPIARYSIGVKVSYLDNSKRIWN